MGHICIDILTHTRARAHTHAHTHTHKHPSLPCASSSRFPAPTAVLARVAQVAVQESADVSSEGERSRGHGVRGRQDVLQPTPPHHHHHPVSWSACRGATTTPHCDRDHFPWNDVNDATRVASPAPSTSTRPAGCSSSKRICVDALKYSHSCQIESCQCLNGHEKVRI